MLPAKPIIDVVLTVESVADEPNHYPPDEPRLPAADRVSGHRLFRTPDLSVSVHVLKQDDEAAVACLDLLDGTQGHVLTRQGP